LERDKMVATALNLHGRHHDVKQENFI